MSQTTINPEAVPQQRKHGAVGTWRQTVQFPDLGITFKTIIAFTSDGIVHQTAVPAPESALGVWESQGEDRFRATFFIFRHDSTGKLVGISRVRASFSLLDDEDKFQGTGTLDQFDPNEQTILRTIRSTLEGIRMEVIPQ